MWTESTLAPREWISSATATALRLSPTYPSFPSFSAATPDLRMGSASRDSTMKAASVIGYSIPFWNRGELKISSLSSSCTAPTCPSLRLPLAFVSEGSKRPSSEIIHAFKPSRSFINYSQRLPNWSIYSAYALKPFGCSTDHSVSTFLYRCKSCT
jgi:hypothetical protein